MSKEGNTIMVEAHGLEQVTGPLVFPNMPEVEHVFDSVPKGGFENVTREVELLIGLNYASLHPDRAEIKGDLAL